MKWYFFKFNILLNNISPFMLWKDPVDIRENSQILIVYRLIGSIKFRWIYSLIIESLVPPFWSLQEPWWFPLQMNKHGWRSEKVWWTHMDHLLSVLVDGAELGSAAVSLKKHGRLIKSSSAGMTRYAKFSSPSWTPLWEARLQPQPRSWWDTADHQQSLKPED